MKVTVVIVTYNPIQWVVRCLESIQNSSIALDSIVIDNGSTDGGQAYIKANYPGVNFIQSATNLGFGAANNIGIKKAYEAGADYVFLLNQDAWVEPNTIEKLIVAQQKQPEFGIVSPIHLNGTGDALDYNFSSYIIPQKCEGLYSDILLKREKKGIYELPFVNAAGWLLSRKCIEIVGGFNPSFFHYAEDDNYIQRVKYHQLKVGVLGSCFLYHDRLDRKQNPFWQDEKELYKRKMILKTSNPVSEFNLKIEQKQLIKTLVKAIVSINLKLWIETKWKLKVIANLNNDEIVEMKNKSRIKQLSFLN